MVAAAGTEGESQPPRVIFCENEPLCFEDEEAAPPLTPLAGARRHVSSHPKDLGLEKNAWETTCHAMCFLHQAPGSAVSPKNQPRHTLGWLEAPGSCRGVPTKPQLSATRSSAHPLGPAARRVCQHGVSGEQGLW